MDLWDIHGLILSNWKFYLRIFLHITVLYFTHSPGKILTLFAINSMLHIGFKIDSVPYVLITFSHIVILILLDTKM